jgi:hypothetical protein
MHRHSGAAFLSASAVVLIGAGVWLDAWWTIAGGLVAGAAAAWLVTEPETG